MKEPSKAGERELWVKEPVNRRRQDKMINQGENMKLSVEAKVAAVVAAGFIALTVGVIAQGRSEGQTSGPNNYGATNNLGVDIHISQQGYNSSLPGRTNAEENRQKFSDEQQTTTTRKKGG